MSKSELELGERIWNRERKRRGGHGRREQRAAAAAEESMRWASAKAAKDEACFAADGVMLEAENIQ